MTCPGREQTGQEWGERGGGDGLAASTCRGGKWKPWGGARSSGGELG